MVTLRDLNDYAPRFPSLPSRVELDAQGRKRLRLSLSESTPVDSEFDLPTAVDLDGPANSVRRYSLQGHEDTFRLSTTVDRRGIVTDVTLVTRGPLDRELRSTYELILVADDLVNPPAKLFIQVIVQDVNDNRPKFSSRTYTAHVDERATGGEVVVRVTAEDKDGERFGRVRYSLEWAGPNTAETPPPFAIHPDTGRVTVATGAALDRETRPEYRLLVRARDGGDEEAGGAGVTARLRISLVDFNDNAPRITVHGNNGDDGNDGIDGREQDEAARVNVEEEKEAGEHMAHFSVSDADAGDNGRVDCALVDPQALATTAPNDYDNSNGDARHFRLKKLYDGQYELVTSALLDREVEDMYRVALQCGDNPASPEQRLTTEVIVTVKVMDVNDNSPVFEDEDSEISVYENIPIEQVMYTFVASDTDNGRNGDVTYSLISEGEDFLVDPQGGQLRRRHTTLDRELGQSYTVKVAATDNGYPAKSRRVTTTTLRITVMDRDDNVPRFPAEVTVDDAGYRFAVAGVKGVAGVGGVAGVLPAGSIVGEVKASDPDTARYAAFTYSLEASRHADSTTSATASDNGPPVYPEAVRKATDYFSVHPLTGVIRCRKTLILPAYFRFWVVASDPAGRGQRVAVTVTSQARRKVVWTSPVDGITGTAKQTDSKSTGAITVSRHNGSLILRYTSSAETDRREDAGRSVFAVQFGASSYLDSGATSGGGGGQLSHASFVYSLSPTIDDRGVDELTINRVTGWLTSERKLTGSVYRFRVKARLLPIAGAVSEDPGYEIDVLLRVYNASDAELTAAGDSSTLTTVILLATVSGVVAVLLMVTIAAVVIRQRRRLPARKLTGCPPSYQLLCTMCPCRRSVAPSTHNSGITVVKSAESRVKRRPDNGTGYDPRHAPGYNPGYDAGHDLQYDPGHVANQVPVHNNGRTPDYTKSQDSSNKQKCPSYIPCPTYTMAMRARSVLHDSANTSTGSSGGSGSETGTASAMDTGSTTGNSSRSSPSAVTFADIPECHSSPNARHSACVGASAAAGDARTRRPFFNQSVYYRHDTGYTETPSGDMESYLAESREIPARHPREGAKRPPVVSQDVRV